MTQSPVYETASYEYEPKLPIQKESNTDLGYAESQARPQSEEIATHTDYEELLKQIPGFETYGKQIGSSDVGPDVETNVTVADNINWADGTQIDTTRSPELRKHHTKFELNVQNNFLDLLPKLKLASREREHIGRLEVRLSNQHRSVFNSYDTLAGKLGEIFEILQHGPSDQENAAKPWLQELDDTRAILDSLTNARAELEPTELELLNARERLKNLEDDYFAHFAGGERPGDSVASDEDRKLFSLGGRQNSTNGSSLIEERPLPEDQELSTIDEVESPFVDRTDSEPFDSLIGSTLFADSVIGLSPSVLVRSGFMTNRTGSPFQSLVHESIGGRLQFKNSRNNPTSTSHHTIKSFAAESVGIGYLLHDLTRPTRPRINASRRHPILASTIAMVEFRRNDFKLALGMDLDAIGNPKQSDQQSRAQSSQLSNIKVPVIRKNAYIAFWGREMSQNSILEAWRTNLYASDILQDLIKRGSIGPLHQYVQNVRRLEARFDSDWGPDTLILAQSDNRSVSVQAPGSVRKSETSSGRGSAQDLLQYDRLKRQGSG